MNKQWLSISPPLFIIPFALHLDNPRQPPLFKVLNQVHFTDSFGYAMTTTHASSLAAEFLHETVLAIMSDPPFNAPSLPIGPERESLAARISQATLKSARERLESSKASIAFEATCIQNKTLLLESIESQFGKAPLDALLTDPSAPALPERSQSSLSAWRFPDGSFILTCKANDESFSRMGQALAASPRAREALGPDGISKLEKSQLHGWGSFGAFPLSAPSMDAFVNSLCTADGDSWLPGSVYIDRDTGKALSPQAMREAIAPVAAAMPSLDAALAEVFGRKSSSDEKQQVPDIDPQA